MDLETGEFLWYLEGMMADGRTWVIPVDRFPFKIGRHKDCQLALSSSSVSRYHAELFHRDARLYVRDLESKNGTYVNFTRLLGDQPLRDGDAVHFGEVGFRVGHRDKTERSEETTGLPTALGELPGLLAKYESDLHNLLRRRSVSPHFQPIVHMIGGARHGYEVIGRGNHEGLPTQPHDLFLLADGMGCGAQLSRIFWQEGLAAGARIKDARSLFINVHPAELVHQGLIEALREARPSIASIGLTVEISEKWVTDLELMKRLRGQLGDLDIRLAYDDFGAGQSRFHELIEVPPHYLKFDISLVRAIHQKPKRFQHVVGTLVKMAHDLGIATVAEGIESDGEKAVCSEMGFQFAQGFFFGRPVPAIDLRPQS
jgi:EAL domain-containing protein (putative c-di-GMP-specific phosphodiesterase class I)